MGMRQDSVRPSSWSLRERRMSIHIPLQGSATGAVPWGIPCSTVLSASHVSHKLLGTGKPGKPRRVLPVKKSVLQKQRWAGACRVQSFQGNRG